MSGAARQRLLRNRPDNQLSLDLPSGHQRGAPAPGTNALAAARDEIRGRFTPADDPWAGSSNEWLKNLPPVSRYRAGVALVHAWAQAHEVTCTVRRRGGLLTPAGVVDVKVSTLWASNEYVFQGLREGSDQVAMLGFGPEDIALWLVPTATLLQHLDKATRAGGWVSVAAHATPAWLAGHQATPGALHARTSPA